MSRLRCEDNRLIWQQGQETLWIEPWNLDGIRVRANLAGRILDQEGALLAEQAPQTALIAIDAQGARLQNGRIAANITAAGQISFYDVETDRLLLAEELGSVARPAARTFRSRGGGTYELVDRFAAQEDERFYGLGQHQHGRLDQKGCVIDLVQRNTEISIPFLVSSRGYGFLWNNPAVGRVELAANGTCWVAEATAQLDYVVVASASYAGILTRYADLTGYPPALPEWALGFWQSKLRYRTQAELLGVAREYHRRGLRLAVIVIDFFHWTHMGDWRFDAVDWPDPAAMVTELEAMGTKLMVSVWPSVNPESVNFTEMSDRGFLVNTERGVPAHSVFLDVDSPAAVYLAYFDPTNPAARNFVWEQLRRNYFAHGIRAWWLDACEPEIKPQDHDNLRYFLGNGAQVGCLYPLRYQQMFADGMHEEGESEVVLLTRSAWAGSQRYGTVVWSGDIPSTFSSLQRQVRAGLNMAMSGIPWWTTDIGGFQGGDIRDPAFRELMIRWFQYAVFCPIFRLHGYREPGLGHLETGAGNEVWSFGDEAYAILRDLLSLRERLRPYLAEQMNIAHEQGIPPMRPLFFDFGADPHCASVEDQFMLGTDLLVAPVLSQGARSRTLYLPQGVTWLRPDTGEAFPGGSSITVEAPLEVVPYFVRSSSALLSFAPP